MSELQWMKEEPSPRGAGWFYNDLHLCAGTPLQGKRVYERVARTTHK